MTGLLLLSVDGCTNYTVLSEAHRAQGNALQNNPTCDHNLVTGWYRFQGAAGDRMADKCVLQYRCGTERPVWLQGAHPGVTEGVVTRAVCYSYRDSCCTWRGDIKVKNCSSYYVYELQKLPSCSYRYCGNAGTGKLHSISECFKTKHKMRFKYVEVNTLKTTGKQEKHEDGAFLM